MNYNYKFTVFTPTYNRAHTLERVFNSLNTQTFNDFEWLIIDDGSTDNTKEIVAEFKQKANFPINYHYKNNGGKHTAINLGVSEAQGELFLTFDSDDACVPEALEVFNDAWEGITEKEKFSAVTGLCMDEEGVMHGTKYPKDNLDSNAIELRYLYKVKGEKWGFQRTDIMRQYPFPEPEGLKYFQEDVIWNQISKKYKTRFINKALRIYIQGEDSYTMSAPQKHAKASAILQTSILNNCLDYFKHHPMAFFKSGTHYIRFSLHSKSPLFTNLESFKAKLLALICLPVGILVFIKDRIKYK